MIHSKKRRIIVCISVFVIFLLLIVCAVKLDSMVSLTQKPVEEFDVHISVVLPEKIYVANEAVIDYMNDTDTAKNIFNNYRQYGRLDYTKAVDFIYTIENIPVDCTIVSQQITITDKDSSKQIFQQSFFPENRSVSLENLRPDTNYEYVISIEFSNGNILEETGEFKTEASLCFLFVDGARNFRDIGSAKTVDGKRIKNYMVYRGAELDGAMESRYVLTQDGIDYMVNVLGIKTEIDLRWYDEKIMNDVLGDSVNHIYFPMSAYNDFFDTNHSVNNAKTLFSELAKEDSYPVYIHCSYGADRTGTIIYVLQALLGVDEQALYNEWECSVICNGDSFYEEMDAFLIRFKALDGETMQEKAENYLLSIGVTQQEIDSIRDILLTD